MIVFVIGGSVLNVENCVSVNNVKVGVGVKR